MSDSPITVRVARWSATHPWRAITLWLALVLACVAVGASLSTRQATDLQLGTGQSGQAEHWRHDSGMADPDTENVLITAHDGRLNAAQNAEAGAAAAQVAARMRALPQVARVAAPQRAPDGSAVLVQVTLHSSADDANVAPLQAATKAVGAAHPQLQVAEVGDVSLNKAINHQVAADLGAAASYSLPITLLIMVIAFGAIIAAGVPVLLAISAVGAATGLSALVSHLIPDSGTTSSMILLMGMAVGVDYSLFFVRRARAERRRGHDQLDAVEIAARTSGHSVLVSGAAVIISMCGLFLADNLTFASLAAGSIVVVAVAVLGSLTVLPALLVKLGHAIERPRLPVLWRLTDDARTPRLWPAMLRPALRHPGRTLIAAVLVLGVLALPVLGMHLISDSQRSLPNSIAEKHTLDRLTAAFPGQHVSDDVVVRAPAAQAAAVTARLDALAASASRNPLFVSGRHQVVASPERTVHLLVIDAPYDAESGRAHDGVRELRGGLVGGALRGVPGAHWAVGGDAAANLDADNQLGARLPYVIGFVVLFTLIVMGWVFRSVLIAVGTAVINLLSAGAAFGVLVLVFQNSWAEGILGFRSTGGVINWVPLFTFAVLFGLSMDYHVFVLGHIREAARRGLAPREAIRAGITGSAGTVTSAAIVMVSVFAIFATQHMIEMKELGVGLAVAVLVDVLIVRGILLPALLMLLGRRIGWYRGPADPGGATEAGRHAAPALSGAPR